MRDLPLVRFGWLAGGTLGVAAGATELVLMPLSEPARVPFVLGADGLLGGGWGLLVAGALRMTRGKGAAAARGLLAALVLPVLAAGLGLFANRVLLRGTHFLSPVSLAADAVCVLVALGLSVAAGRAGGTRIARRVRTGPLVPLGLGVVLSAAFALPGRLSANGSADENMPSLVLVSIDTLRPDRLSVGGEPRPTSPEIDRLVREGVQATEAVAVSPGSAASHAALLTSRYPVSSGVFTNFSVMDTSVTTLAEVLHEKGYRTGGFVTNTFLGRRFQFDQGFDTYVESGVVERLEEASRAALHRSLALVQIVDRLRARFDVGYDPSFETALAWITESKRPVLFFVHLMDVHSPYVPPHPYGPRFGAHPDGTGRGPRNRFGWRPSEEAYVAEIRFADAKIGRLRRVLEATDRLDESVIVLTSDHGENLRDHEPPFSHGVTLFDSTLRILASVRWPGRVRPGGLNANVFENVDVIPTLASLCAWDTRQEWNGVPLGAASPRRVTYAQLNRDFAVRTTARKAIVKESGERELFALDEDPGETDGEPLDPERAALVESDLRSWIDRHATDLYLERARSLRPDDLSPETVEKLRGLGYLD